MKKYRQGLILVVSILGVTGLFLYRNEYIRLKSTLEMFDVLNSESGFSVQNCLVLNDSSIVKDNIDRLAFPRPVWKGVADFEFYSAFGEEKGDDGKFRGKAIGLGKAANSIHFQCHIWFNFKDVVLSTNGKFAYTAEAIDKSETIYYEFLCDGMETLKGDPYMIVFIDVTEGRKYFLPIFRPVFSSSEFSSALCVYPDLTVISKKLVVEFLSFHEILGFTDVIVYDIGLHYGLLKRLGEIVSASHSLRSFSVLDWNIPSTNARVSKFLLEKDCLYRTSGQVDVVVALGWNDYLIPQEGFKLKQLFQNYTSLINSQVDLPTRICCTDKRDTKGSEKSWPRVLRKTQCIEYFRENLIVMNPKLKPLQHSEKLTLKKGSISLYDNCYNIGSKKTQFDPSPLEYLVNLMASKILRLWKSGTFFT